MRCLLVLLTCLLTVLAGRHHHNNNNRLIELLTAGIVAKVLQTQEGDREGGQEYYPLHIPIPMGSHKHHHHVTEKIIPIPIPHHTTRIIHINAGSPHGGEGSQGGGYEQGGGGGLQEGGYQSGGYQGGGYQGGAGYTSPSYGSAEHQNPDDESPSSHHHSAPSIQQLFFQDSGVYAPPAVPGMRHPTAYIGYRRPTMGMVPAAHHAYLVRTRYPYVAMRHRMPGTHPTPYAPPIYAVPYQRMPAAASYMNPLVLRRPSVHPPAMMPPVW